MRSSRLLFCCLALSVRMAVAFAADPDDADPFKRGTELIEPYMVVVDREAADPTTPEAKKQIAEGIRLLAEVTRREPANWSAFWFIGKGEQARRNHAAAESAFKRAFELNPAQTTVGRELMIESICTGHSAGAV